MEVTQCGVASEGSIDNALIAAHKALSLTPNDVSVLLLLANSKANRQAALSSEHGAI